jgi:hypothetical protein
MSNQVEELEDAIALTLMIGFMALLGWGLWKANDFFWGGARISRPCQELIRPLRRTLARRLLG